MITITKKSFTSVVLITSLFAAQTSAWTVGLWSTQNSCGGDWAADTSRSGDAGKTSSCQTFGIIELRAMEVENWDDGCKIIAYDSWSCENELMTWDKERWGSEDGKWSCINNIELPTWEAFKYVCE